MSVRKITGIITVLLFIAAIAVGISGKTIEKRRAEKEYMPTVSTVCITATGDCTFATDANAPRDNSFVSCVEAQNNDYSYFSGMSRRFLLRMTLQLSILKEPYPIRGQGRIKPLLFAVNLNMCRF